MAYPTNPIYKLFKDPMKGNDCGVKLKTGANSQKLIPFAPDNTDYQEYLKWVDEGNTAEAAD